MAAPALTETQPSGHSAGSSVRHVRFKSVNDVILIDSIAPEHKDNVYGAAKTSPMDQSVLYELNLYKLGMEVHPGSRKNTHFYAIPGKRLCDLLKDCRDQL